MLTKLNLSEEEIRRLNYERFYYNCCFAMRLISQCLHFYVWSGRRQEYF
jgi:hypothetical protein